MKNKDIGRDNKEDVAQQLLKGSGIESADIVQRAIKGETGLLKGLIKYSYKSVWSFIFTYIIAVLYLFMGLFGLSILIAGVIEALQQQAILSFVPGATFLLAISVILFVVGIKISRKLVAVFKAKDKSYKIKIVLLLTVPTILLIFVFIFVLRVIFSMNFVF